jgi:hypothetical protein
VTALTSIHQYSVQNLCRENVNFNKTMFVNNLTINSKAHRENCAVVQF